MPVNPPVLYDGMMMYVSIAITLSLLVTFPRSPDAHNPGSSWRNTGAFAALKTDGSIVAWGGSNSGGWYSWSSSVSMIYSTDRAFAALKTDGSVESPPSTVRVSSGASVIYSTERAFAALKTDGSVVTWGNSNYGGDSSSVSSSLSIGASAIYSNDGAFAALKTDGSVVTWGSGNGGDSSSVSSSLNSGVSVIYSTRLGFAALKTNGIHLITTE